MIKTTAYRANDGTLFETEQECLLHENNKLVETIANSIKTYLNTYYNQIDEDGSASVDVLSYFIAEKRKDIVILLNMEN